MKKQNLTPLWQFLRNHRYRILMIGMLFLYSCELTDDEVLSSRQAFVGSFEMKQTCGSSRDNYTLRIRTGSGNNEVLLDNVEPFGDELIATVNGNLLTISSQSVRLSGQSGQPTSVMVSGSGILTDGSILELEFDFEYGGSNSCSASGFKL